MEEVLKKKNVISTWIYLDDKDSAQKFSQTHMLSSSKAHQDIYWRCVYVFFKFAQLAAGVDYEYVLFTNYKEKSLIVDGIDILKSLELMNVKIIQRDFTYKLPRGYYGSWGNQLYEFDILDEFSSRYKDSKLLMLDSDCIITKNINEIFERLDFTQALTFRGEYNNYPKDEKIDGISEREMLILANSLLDENHYLEDFKYICGEFFAATSNFIEIINKEFPNVYSKMVDIYNKENNSSAIKFNEEAHFLSFFYLKYNIEVGTADKYIKRLWSDDSYYKIKPEDIELPIWHCITQKNRYIQILKNIDSIMEMTQDNRVQCLKKIIFPSDFKYKIITRDVKIKDIIKFIAKKLKVIKLSIIKIGKKY